MVLIPNLENLTPSSGVINMPYLEGIYRTVMDEALQTLGGNRGPVTFHLPPLVQQDTPTQAKLAPQQYNPFFQRTPVPQANTRNSGTKVTYRDVEYTAHITIGPLDLSQDDRSGIGNLSVNQAAITVVVEALVHIKQAISVSIEGRRYKIVDTKPIGFSVRRYVIVKLEQIEESEPASPDNTVG